MNRYQFTVQWTLCRCPQCGHEQEAESETLATRGAKCEECGQPTAPAAREQEQQP